MTDIFHQLPPVCLSPLAIAGGAPLVPAPGT